MKNIFPFIKQKKKKDNFEQIPLYIEDYYQEIKEKEDKKEEESHIIIIDMF